MAKYKNGLSKFNGLYVELPKQGDNAINLDRALKKLKRMIKDDNLMLTIHENSYFTKPSEKRRDERAKSKARMKSSNRRNNL